jgi:hypothetical protein
MFDAITASPPTAVAVVDDLHHRGALVPAARGQHLESRAGRQIAGSLKRGHGRGPRAVREHSDRHPRAVDPSRRARGVGSVGPIALGNVDLVRLVPGLAADRAHGGLRRELSQPAERQLRANRVVTRNARDHRSPEIFDPSQQRVVDRCADVHHDRRLGRSRSASKGRERFEDAVAGGLLDGAHEVGTELPQLRCPTALLVAQDADLLERRIRQPRGGTAVGLGVVVAGSRGVRSAVGA